VTAQIKTSLPYSELPTAGSLSIIDLFVESNIDLASWTTGVGRGHLASALGRTTTEGHMHDVEAVDKRHFAALSNRVASSWYSTPTVLSAYALLLPF
jgi:hypothetical protein